MSEVNANTLLSNVTLCPSKNTSIQLKRAYDYLCACFCAQPVTSEMNGAHNRGVITNSPPLACRAEKLLML